MWEFCWTDRIVFRRRQQTLARWEGKHATHAIFCCLKVWSLWFASTVDMDEPGRTLVARKCIKFGVYEHAGPLCEPSESLTAAFSDNACRIVEQRWKWATSRAAIANHSIVLHKKKVRLNPDAEPRYFGSSLHGSKRSQYTNLETGRPSSHGFWDVRSTPSSRWRSLRWGIREKSLTPESLLRLWTSHKSWEGVQGAE